ncbi:hypothetical protein [Saccharomonospora azurea]|uniref:hypothetical protein n=1 Tax=Saccharomonospora azurea TaxID=40988 RepID=UPI002409A1E5|nr:hypothetical protein [Saccharomonospora azurea]
MKQRNQGRDTIRFRLALDRSDLAIALVGLLTGAFAAVAYYSFPLRSLAHTFGVWIVLSAMVAKGNKPIPACKRVSIALLAAVFAFYVGKGLTYSVLYSGTTYPVHVFDLVVWSGLAVAAGAALGLSLRFVGDRDWRGTIATASAIGLAWGDVIRRIGFDLGDDLALTLFTVLVTALLLAVGSRSLRQVAGNSLLAIPLIVPGFLIASAPDLLEQLLITGSFSGIL